MRRSWFAIPFSLTLSLALLLAGPARSLEEAASGLDEQTIEASQKKHDKAKKAFDDVEVTENKIGPVYNAQSCRECHQNLAVGGTVSKIDEKSKVVLSGTSSQFVEHRAGHIKDGKFVPPIIPINKRADTIAGRTLVNDRAICVEAQERLPHEDSKIQTNRIALNTRGDGFVEVVPDEQILQTRKAQCNNDTKIPGAEDICGQAIPVPILEAPGERRIGRFGWKNQHASLLSFSADAYLNEMGITSRLLDKDVTPICDFFPETKKPPFEDDENDIDQFALFMRGTKVIPPEPPLSEEPRKQLENGQSVFEKVGCGICHKTEFTTPPAGTTFAAGKITVTKGLGDKIIHPFSDFLLHDIGTGDGIPIPPCEHYGRKLTAELNNLERRTRNLTESTADPLYVCEVKISDRQLFYPAQLEIATNQPKCEGKALFAQESAFLEALSTRKTIDGLNIAAGPNSDQLQCTANKLRTAPLWGLRFRSRLMHDGNSGSIQEAIDRHGEKGEAVKIIKELKDTTRFSDKDRLDLIAFLNSL